MVEFDTPDTAETAIGKLSPITISNPADHSFSPPAAKFTGYQYGGRPLGITFVKYLNAGAGSGDVMEDAQPTGGITQDQIM